MSHLFSSELANHDKACMKLWVSMLWVFSMVIFHYITGPLTAVLLIMLRLCGHEHTSWYRWDYVLLAMKMFLTVVCQWWKWMKWVLPFKNKWIQKLNVCFRYCLPDYLIHFCSFMSVSERSFGKQIKQHWKNKEGEEKNCLLVVK